MERVRVRCYCMGRAKFFLATYLFLFLVRNLNYSISTFFSVFLFREVLVLKLCMIYVKAP